MLRFVPVATRKSSSKRSSVTPATLKSLRDWLDKRFSTWTPALTYSTPWELLAATILSAQCTDARVNQVTPGLFARYPTAEAMAEAEAKEVEALIRSTGFFRAKRRNLIESARQLVAEHGGVVPDQMDLLLGLTGIGRKTANVVLANAFGQPAIVVDTHVRRVSQRLGLTRSADPDKIEQELARIFPPAEWTQRSHQILLHGRYVCLARRPKCGDCGLQSICHWYRMHEKRIKD